MINFPKVKYIKNNNHYDYPISEITSHKLIDFIYSCDIDDVKVIDNLQAIKKCYPVQCFVKINIANSIDQFNMYFNGEYSSYNMENNVYIQKFKKHKSIGKFFIYVDRSYEPHLSMSNKYIKYMNENQQSKIVSIFKDWAFVKHENTSLEKFINFQKVLSFSQVDTFNYNVYKKSKKFLVLFVFDTELEKDLIFSHVFKKFGKLTHYVQFCYTKNYNFIEKTFFIDYTKKTFNRNCIFIQNSNLENYLTYPCNKMFYFERLDKFIEKSINTPK
ncbi:hypothetical protein A3Q56_04933, partial [Intoshia linei]